MTAPARVSWPVDWPERLAAFLASRRAAPFQWGAHDCVTFACDWAAIATGRDPLSPWRGRYANAFAAWRRIRETGADSVLGAGRKLFGAEIAPEALQRGDVAVVPSGLAEPWHFALGVVQGARVAAPAQAGIVFVPLAAAIAGFRV